MFFSVNSECSVFIVSIVRVLNTSECNVCIILSIVQVLYDGECNICMKEIGILQKFAKKRPVDFIDINTPSFTAKNYSGVTYEMAMKEMHVIGANGMVGYRIM